VDCKSAEPVLCLLGGGSSGFRSIQKILTLARFRNGAPPLLSARKKKKSNTMRLGMNIRVSITLMNPRISMVRVCTSTVTIIWTDLAMTFQGEPFFFLWKFACHSTALRSYVLSSGPNTGSGAKDTDSEQVARRVPKTIRDFIQGLRSHSGKG
jgi:hypothetical protein